MNELKLNEIKYTLLQNTYILYQQITNHTMPQYTGLFMNF